MASVTITPRGNDKPTATVGRSSYGLFISFEVGGVTLYVPGDDDEAIENARTWAAQLLNAAATVGDRLAAINSVVPEVTA